MNFQGQIFVDQKHQTHHRKKIQESKLFQVGVENKSAKNHQKHVDVGCFKCVSNSRVLEVKINQFPVKIVNIGLLDSLGSSWKWFKAT